MAYFRLLTGHVYQQAHLHRIGVSDSPACTLCESGAGPPRGRLGPRGETFFGGPWINSITRDVKSVKTNSFSLNHRQMKWEIEKNPYFFLTIDQLQKQNNNTKIFIKIQIIF